MAVTLDVPEVTYGVDYRDRATGFLGRAVAVWHKWEGPTQVCLARLGSDGKPIEQWFDLGRIEPGDSQGGLGFGP